MKVEQLYTGCLAEAAYYIESNGEIAIIDPLREVDQYIEMAEANNAKITYIFETHFHADFVSGHVDLAKKTGATIVYGPTTMETGFDAYIAKDDEEFKLGNVVIKALHTPGHTMESTTYLLIDENGKEHAIFTGDTLFIGDVGRPDLAQKVIAEMTQEKLANHLYDSLQNKILPLNNDIIVYPGHGAGSPCGKKMSKETTDTLGNQKKTNYALREGITREEFVSELLDGLTPPPGYFPQNVLMNIKGYESIDTVLDKGTQALSPEAFEAAAAETNAIIIDTRAAQIFKDGFVPGSINIGIDGSFAIWAGTVIPDVTTPLLIVADEGREEETIIRLARVGFDNTLGYLKGGVDAWKDTNKQIDWITSIEASTLATVMHDEEGMTILDVRKKSEFESEHIVDAINVPLDYYKDALTKLDNSQYYYVHCAGGYRSMTFISAMKRLGWKKFIDINGGFGAIKETQRFELTEYVCPSTLL